jgi:hypothetical protein
MGGIGMIVASIAPETVTSHPIEFCMIGAGILSGKKLAGMLKAALSVSPWWLPQSRRHSLLGVTISLLLLAVWQFGRMKVNASKLHLDHLIEQNRYNIQNKPSYDELESELRGLAVLQRMNDIVSN